MPYWTPSHGRNPTVLRTSNSPGRFADADTIKNCWNKVKIMIMSLAVPVTVVTVTVVAGGGTRDDVFKFDELRALLVSMGEECDVLTFVDPSQRDK